ncbi:COR domain-containing protein, partial [Candidatus Albibeggiatoa sp. nov. BB20]|uniref:COR domain-containing protein n=1 Tax=Candidatus Albibeggiatoa sp. nov. BB20 TaxID=3162723 RepID=UPI003365B035
FGQLQNLSYLSLSGNQLKELPASFGQLQNLSILYLWNNSLKELPASFGQLQNLSVLYLFENPLKELPTWFGQLQNLSELGLSKNQLKELPVSLGQLKNSCKLDISGNPLETPPLEIAEKGIEAIRNYFAEKERQPLNEAKILIVGQGGVGKTSLLNRLLFNEFDEHENKTDGINIQNWQVDIKNEQIRLNVWDFGGQEIMHATHQFFLTKRSLYLLVLDARQEEQYSRVEYWLKMIKTYGADSPILIVINKIDQHSTESNERQLLRDYPNIKGFYSISCKDNQNLENLKQHIFTCIEQLPHIHDLLPKTWFEIKTKLENMRRDFIPYTEYEKICDKNNINRSSQKTLIDFLHDLGIMLNYRDDEQRPKLRETNILNPKWITEGIYKILNSNQLFQEKGKLKLSQLSEILDAEKYPINKHDFILNIMEKFELCFEFPEQKNHFLIPDLLSKQEPELNWPHDDCLEFELHYDVLPSSIISRFIVRQHHIASKQTYWRTGIVLAQDNNKALVIANLENKEITISVIGQENGRRGLLTTIRNTFNAIHNTFKILEVTEQVPYEGILIPYQNLLNLEKAGFETHFEPSLSKEINVTQLLSGIKGEVKMGDINIKGDVKGSNVSTGDNTEQSIGDSKPDDSKWSWNLGHVLTAIAISIAVLTSIAIWVGNVFTSENTQSPPPQTPATLSQPVSTSSNAASQPVTPTTSCIHSVMLYDKSDLKTVPNAKVYFLYQNDKHTFYGDSEGFYKATLDCDIDSKDGKIHVEAEGYQVYERGFKLSNNMQEIRLSPEN